MMLQMRGGDRSGAGDGEVAQANRGADTWPFIPPREKGAGRRTRTRLRIYRSTMQRVRDRPRQRGLGRSAMDELLVTYVGRLIGR